MTFGGHPILARLRHAATSAVWSLTGGRADVARTVNFGSDWRWKSRPRGGRPKTPLEIRHLIREMSLANPLWGVLNGAASMSARNRRGRSFCHWILRRLFMMLLRDFREPAQPFAVIGVESG